MVDAYGYLIGYFKHNEVIREALITISLVESSQIKDTRLNEVYDLIKADLVRVVCIENLDGQKINSAYLLNRPKGTLKYEVKESEIVRFKNCNFNEMIPNLSYIGFYTTKLGALNKSQEVNANFSGVKYYYYPNGKLKNKHYYVKGSIINMFGYYNNEFNSLYYTWVYQYSDNSHEYNVREYIYDTNETCLGQFIFENQKLINQIIYADHNFVESRYLNKIK